MRVFAWVLALSGCAPAPAPPREDPATRYARAVEAARRAGRDGTPLATGLLVQALARPDPQGWLHRAAIEALGARRDAAALGALVRVIEAPEGSLEFFQRRLAARALGAIADRRAAEPLARNLGRREGPLKLEADVRAALGELTGAAGARPVATPPR